MKKLLLIVCSLSFMAAGAFSQSLVLYDTNWHTLSNNTTITIYGPPNNDEIIAYAYVKNITGNAIPVKVKKVERNVLPGTINLFCWGLCFGPTIYVSPDPVIIAAGAVDTNNFSGHYTPMGVTGISTIRYVFFNANNVNDSICFNVDYDTYPVGISNPTVTAEVSAYPNPANNFVTFSWSSVENLTSRITIYNVLGTIVKETEVTGTTGKTTFDLSDLRQGVYFYTLSSNGYTKSARKLIIKH